MKKIILALILLPGLAFAQPRGTIKTNYQTGSNWGPGYDVRCDAVMLYGFSALNDAKRFSWTDRGYKLQTMIGISWGGYEDYFNGTYDGIKHLEEIAQRDMNGEILWHDKGKVPYFIPTKSLLEYFNSKLRKLVDVGITEFFFEEPEIWLTAGYGEAFKKEWKDFYHEDWKPQHESAENTFKSNKLKHHLYTRAIEEITTGIKEYGRDKGINIKCYIATHSIINYCLWNIVSPEAATSNIKSVDGYIAQVWTGTSRYPSVYNGYYKARLFEMALMEYSSLEALSKPVGKDMYFLTDPIEDAPQHWDLYKRGYEATYTAEILYPDVDKYEVMPWPDRIFHGSFRTSAESTTLEKMPASYATQVQIMVNALMKMPKTENRISGPSGISVLLSNSLMFQRFVADNVYDYEDNLLSNYYGLVLPLLKRGIHVSTVHMDNLMHGLDSTRILLMSYSAMKPLDSESHRYITEWVRNGGILIYQGLDNDRFQNIKEWWSSAGYNKPSEHLFQSLGIGKNPKSGTYQYGNGTIFVERSNPERNILVKQGDTKYLSLLEKAYSQKSGKLNYTNYFALSRGIYDITSVLTESITDAPVVKEGHFVDLYTDSLPVLKTKSIKPGEQSLLVNIDRVDKNAPSILATAARAYDEQYESNSYSFTTKGPKNVKAVTRVYLTFSPKSVMIDGTESFDVKYWDSETNTYLLKYDCNPDGTSIVIRK